MIRTALSMLALGTALVAAPASAATILTSTAADGSNHLPVPGSTINMTFDLDAGTAVEAEAKGLTATFDGQLTSRTTANPSGTTDYGVFAVAPAPYDGNGYYAIGGIGTDGVQSALTLMGKQAFSNISFFVGSLDAYNTVQLLDATGTAIETYTGYAMGGGVSIPFPGNQSPEDNRRVTFTGTDGTVFYGAKFYNLGDTSAFEFDNVSFTAAVPEPATWAMMIMGFGMVGFAARRRRSSSTAGNAMQTA